MILFWNTSASGIIIQYNANLRKSLTSNEQKGLHFTLFLDLLYLGEGEEELLDPHIGKGDL